MTDTLIIGPSYPETRDLFQLEFWHDGQMYPSLFHAAIRSASEAMTVVEAHRQYVLCAKDNPIFFHTAIPALFGSYACQHYVEVYNILVRYPTVTYVHIEGLTKEPVYHNITAIRDLIQFFTV